MSLSLSRQIGCFLFTFGSVYSLWLARANISSLLPLGRQFADKFTHYAIYFNLVQRPIKVSCQTYMYLFSFLNTHSLILITMTTFNNATEHKNTHSLILITMTTFNNATEHKNTHSHFNHHDNI